MDDGDTRTSNILACDITEALSDGLGKVELRFRGVSSFRY
ncbi:predicted protein [Sclerotinia sclerotiorum 1980 UF-70]|uniref:Uncharacterized protein n=1 Tax=Sclerotinia sclerotiorum (strain ATCC 18683 / 1980 / Ss-1) TaxID=665079 RepID=A7F9M4_SCLS1|nr:predicted protein [Sclerotinia sclerotiorum 1980 UF-70]EDO00435.1 predicted protein [Sclerotinia sclerotiorum 1980 UF-70]